MFKRERLISEELSEIFSKTALAKFGDKLKRFKKGEPHATKFHLSTKAKDMLKKRIKEIRPLAAIGQIKRRRPHYCQVCGKVIETSKPRYCPECWRVALARAAKNHLTPERIAFFKSVLYKPTPEEQSERAKKYWTEFKKLPLDEQKKLNLEHASSRRKRIIQRCVICDKQFEIIPSQVGKLFTCRSEQCKFTLHSHRQLGKRHTPEAIAKMSVYAKKRHIGEPLFGRN